MASWLHTEIFDGHNPYDDFPRRSSDDCCLNDGCTMHGAFKCALTALWLITLLVLVISLGLILGLYHNQHVPDALAITAIVAGLALLVECLACVACTLRRRCCDASVPYDSV